jgi:hypothetical protein
LLHCVLQVMMLSDLHQHPQLLEWRRKAEAAWREPSHPGWQVLQEEIVSAVLHFCSRCGISRDCDLAGVGGLLQLVMLAGAAGGERECSTAV